MQEEQVILVNEKDEPIGLCPKMEAHEKALLHRAFSVFIFNNKGELLLQQRAAHKYHSPRLWTNTVCSHQRDKETNLQAGKRRLDEEMGMRAPLEEVFHFVYQAKFDNGLTEHELDHVMIGFSDENPVINPDEVMNFKWETLENIEVDIQNNPDKYTEWFKIIFANSLNKLQKRLEEHFLSKPLIFEPIFKEKPWGGNKLHKILGKNIPSDKTGESWEISDIEDNFSIVASGYFKGKSLPSLLKKYGAKLVGKKAYRKFNNAFPLLIKYIDAADDLSIQVHPDDQMAQKEHQSFGKNELWHVIQADKGAALYIGFKENTTKEDYLKHLESGKLEMLLNKIGVQTGDTFYIPAGMVHAIGKGILLAEVQQTSDITYRIYDWNRNGLDGKPRELHTELALQAIDFKAQADKRNEKRIITPYFTVEKMEWTKDSKRDLRNSDSFIVLMNTGKGKFIVNGINFNTGDTLFLPAVVPELDMKVLEKGEVLMVYN